MIVGNFIVIAVIYRSESLQNATGIFMANLAITDLTLGVILMPITIISSVLGRWTFSDVMCKFCGFLNVMLCSTSALTVMLLSIDRFIAISRPMQYFKLMSKKRALLLSAYMWIHSAIVSTFPLVGWAQYQYVEAEAICFAVNSISYFNFLCASTIFFAIFLIIMSHIYILKVAIKQSHQIVTLTSGFEDITRETMRQMNRKTAKTVLIIVGVYLACWIPYVTLTYIQIYANYDPPAIAVTITSGLIFLNSASNPIIYGTFHRRFRNAFIRSFMPILSKCNLVDEYAHHREQASYLHTSHIARKLNSNQEAM